MMNMKINAHLWSKATRLYGSILALGIVLTLVILLPTVLPPPPAAHATASTTQQQLPSLGVTGVSTPYLCGPDVGYPCTSAGYKGTNATGWAKAYYGCPNASGCAAGTPHNCTLYVAYRLMQNGMINDPGNYGNATDWAKQA